MTLEGKFITDDEVLIQHYEFKSKSKYKFRITFDGERSIKIENRPHFI